MAQDGQARRGAKQLGREFTFAENGKPAANTRKTRT
jgi:hypothetical protein